MEKLRLGAIPKNTLMYGESRLEIRAFEDSRKGKVDSSWLWASPWWHAVPLLCGVLHYLQRSIVIYLDDHRQTHSFGVHGYLI